VCACGGGVATFQAFSVLTALIEYHDQLMHPHMGPKLIPLFLAALAHPDDNVAQQATEIWSVDTRCQLSAVLKKAGAVGQPT
jgi:hypothetical protein